MSRRVMRKFALILAITPFLMGMGSGGPVSDSIPRPKESYRADLVDRQGVLTRVDFLSCDGKTFLPLESLRRRMVRMPLWELLVS